METKSLKEIAIVEYGKSPKHVKTKNSDVPIFGTGGQVGYSKEILFEGPLTVIARKGTLNKPIYYEHGCWIIDTAYGVTCKEEFNAKWLYYNFQNFELASLNEATGVPSINRNALYNIKFLVPSLPEQKKIASILTTVDDKISSIDSQIQQTEQLKKGLMEKLLTEGIGHTEFKETEIGRIPASWNIYKLGEISKITKLAGYEFTEFIKYNENGEIIALRALNVKNGKLCLDNIKRIDRHVSEHLTRSQLNKGDIIFTYVGTIGDVAIIPVSDAYHLAPNVAKITMENGHSTNFFHQYFLSDVSKKEITKYLTTTSQPALSMGNIRKISTITPPLEEQKQIATILSTVDDKLDILNQKKSHYQTLKKGLSQQLLTGQMRVKV